MMLVVLVGGALADTITLDSGAALEGTLTHYEVRGTCNIHVDDGGLSGVDVVLPCARVIRLDRRNVAVASMPEGALLVVPDERAEEPADVSAEETLPPEETLPLVEVAPMTVGEDLAGADVGAEPEPEPESGPEAAIPVAPTPEEQTPVAAVSPEEPAAAEEPVAQAPETEPAPERNRPLGTITWPKIRIDR